MPNHVFNKMFVDFTDTPPAHRKILNLVLEGTADGEIDSFISHLIPFPENGRKDIVIDGEVIGSAFTDQDDEAGTIDGRLWADQNWGSKWGDYDFRKIDSTAGFSTDYGELDINKVRSVADELFVHAYAFTSAWCPPEKALETISRRYRCRITVLSIMEAPEWRYHGVWDNGVQIVDETENLIEQMPERGDTLTDNQREIAWGVFYENCESVVEAMCGDTKRLVPEWEISLESLKKVTIHDIQNGVHA